MVLHAIKMISIASVFGGMLIAAKSAEADYPNRSLMVTAGELNEIQQSEIIAELMGADDGLLVIIDVRQAEEFAKGHIPDAINLPYTVLTDQNGNIEGDFKPTEELVKILGNAGITSQSRVVLYDNEGGFRAARLFWLLEYLGHRKVAILNGGIQAWKRADHQLEVDHNQTVAERYQSAGLNDSNKSLSVSVTPRRSASADWILEHRNEVDTAVIDVRPQHMFNDGHIPWAQNIPWKGNLNADLTMKSYDNLLMHYLKQGITPDHNIVIHCQTGEASAHSYFALRLLGFPRVRLYHRSWAEWGTADDLPKTTAIDGQNTPG